MIDYLFFDGKWWCWNAQIGSLTPLISNGDQGDAA